MDSKPLETEYQTRTGQPMIHVEPSQLYLEADANSPTGFSLWCKLTKEEDRNSGVSIGDTPHKVDQCSIELFQEEIAEMDYLLLRHLSTCCVNDFRTILLLHDKRILGIALEELQTLVRRKCLTPDESMRLRKAIADTLLPGTDRMNELLQRSRIDPKMKDGYILKPARDASCNGIELGCRISQEKWLDHLERLSGRGLLPTEGVYIVQELANHVWYDIVRHEVENPSGEKFHLIASGHMINSKHFVYGPWRIGKDVHVGFREGKGIIMSAVLRPNLPRLQLHQEV